MVISLHTFYPNYHSPPRPPPPELNDFELFRACGPLYPAFAIESLTSIILGFFFTYLALRITVRSDVKKPINAVWLMFRDYVSPATKEWWRLVKTWPDMPKKPCSARIAYCRNLNIAMCIAQALAAFFTVFRWLHFGNVNGLRYLGYAFTCSLMQAELVVLLAPYVPFYKTNVVFVVLFTHAFLICGWVGSLHDGFLFEDASWELFLSTWEPSSLVVTTKGIIIGITASCLGFLCLIQMPFLVLTYFCAGGCRPHQDLPYHYLRLLCLGCSQVQAFRDVVALRGLHITKVHCVVHLASFPMLVADLG